MSDLTEIEAATILVPYIGACYNATQSGDLTQEFIEQAIKAATYSYDYQTRRAGAVQPHWTTILHVATSVQRARESLAIRAMLN